MKTIKIEKNIPIPKTAYRAWPFNEMKIGDSFAVPIADRGRVTQAATQWALRHEGFKFITRQTEDRQSVRVWRVEP